MLSNSKTHIIKTIYRHPNHKINSFLNELEKIMDKLNRNECTYYICGDISIDLKKNSSEILNYKNTLYSYGCKQYLSNNTYIVGWSENNFFFEIEKKCSSKNLPNR